MGNSPATADVNSGQNREHPLESVTGNVDHNLLRESANGSKGGSGVTHSKEQRTINQSCNEATGTKKTVGMNSQKQIQNVPPTLMASGRHASYGKSGKQYEAAQSVLGSGQVNEILRGAENNLRHQVHTQTQKDNHQGSEVSASAPVGSPQTNSSEPSVSRTLGSNDTFSAGEVNNMNEVFGTRKTKWIPKQNQNYKQHLLSTVISKSDLEDDDCKLEFVESDDDIFQLDVDEVLEEEKSFCLMGRFAGRFPGMRHVIQMVRSWMVDCRAEYETNEHVRFRFKNEEDRQTIFEGGPFHLFGKRLFLEKMKEDYVLGAKAFCCLPVWVRLPMLPTKCWNQKALSRIASKLGKPLFMDKFTFEQQKRDFARILVEMDCSTQPVETVSFKMPDGALWNQHIIFEYLPPYCSRCGSEIHLTASCPLTKVENNLKERETEKEEIQNEVHKDSVNAVGDPDKSLVPSTEENQEVEQINNSQTEPGQNSNGESEAVEQSEEDEDNRAEDDSESDGMSTEYEDMSEEAALERLKILKGRNRTCKNPLSEGGGDDLLNEDRFGTKEDFQKPAGVVYESAVNQNGKTVSTLGEKEKISEIVQALQVEEQCETSNHGERGNAKNKKKDVAMNSGKQNTAKMKKRGKDKGLYDAEFFADLVNSPEPTGENLMAGGGGRRAPTLGDKC
nr:DUF4283 domain-containing protein [Ipomoea batatas]